MFSTSNERNLEMEKKIKFSDKSTISKIVYLSVIAILCVSAIVIGIVASNSRKKTDEDTNPPVSDGANNEDDGNNEQPPASDTNGDGQDTEEPTQKTLSFVSPVVGAVAKSHSATVPVFSNTLEEWRIHTGIDISTEDGAEVFAAEAGEVTKVFRDPMLGVTVELTHSETHKSYYSNLGADTVAVKVGDKVEQGTLLGNVGDTTVSEIADEPHLHFELKVNGISVNPLDYFTDESKEASLGITGGSEN